MKSQKICGLICLSKEDINNLFPYVLISVIEKIQFIDHIAIVTPDPLLISSIILEFKKFFPDTKIHIYNDGFFLNDDELDLCGWSKQQIIKLRSHKLQTDYVLSIGADTIILKDLFITDFINNGEIIRYREHQNENNHSKFEKRRLGNIYRILEVEDKNNQNFDYIFDVFMFNSRHLISLELYIQQVLNKNYGSLFPKTVLTYHDTDTIGEWTLYAIFITCILKEKIIEKYGNDFIEQVHSLNDFTKCEYDTNAIHFVKKDFNKLIIFNNIKHYYKFYENNDYNRYDWWSRWCI